MKEKKGKIRARKIRANPLHLSHLHRITHAHSPATVALSLSLSFSLSIPIYWMRFANQRQIIYPHNEVKYKDASQTTGDQFERKSSFTIMWIKKI